MSKFKYHAPSKEIKEAHEKLKEFVDDFDMKRLVPSFFIKLYNAKYFKQYKRDDELTINFKKGPFEYRIQRRLITKPQAANPFIQQVIDSSKQAIDNSRYYDNMLKRKK